MNELFDRIGARTIGIVLLVIAAGMLALAGVNGYAGVNRIFAANALQAARLQALGGDRSEAQRAAREARDWLDTDADVLFAGLDLTDPGAGALLEAAIPRVPQRQRAELDGVLALHRALHGKDPGQGASGGDALAIRALAELTKTGRMTPPVFSADAPPHRVTLCLLAQRQFAAAIAGGDAAAIRQAAGQVYLLLPRHPETRALHALLRGLDPLADTMQVRNDLEQIQAVDERLRLNRLIAVLAPGRAGKLAEAIPQAQRTPAELALTRAILGANGGGGGDTLDTAVVRALREPKEAQLELLIPRAVREGRLDYAKRMIPLLRNERKPPYELLVADAGGDLAELLRLGAGQPRLALKASTPLVAGGRASFHLSNAAGVIPRSALELRLDGLPLANDKVARLGSIVSLEVGAGGSPTLELRVGSTIIFSAQVAP
jgi:hypothetical protein